MSQKHFTHEVFLAHVVSMDLLDYLCPVHKKEVLRVDAFRDLLNKTCQQPTGSMTKEGTLLYVEPGQLVTSVSELARAWEWHRDKVRDFVNALAEREILIIDMHKKFMVLSFPDLAERIAAYIQKGGNNESVAPNHSQKGTSEDKGQQFEKPLVTHNQNSVTHVDTNKLTESGAHVGIGKTENGEHATAGRGSYIQTSIFSEIDNSGTHQMPIINNQNKTE